ncbi:MAG: hypothetical protein HDS66_09930 [Bacteroidales bacterium]|nr:hypothetical protein [Bacteroidales bacterium]
MKKVTFALAALLICLSASAADLFKGCRYQGIGKIQGQPIDAWVNMTVDDGDLEFNMANTFDFAAEYTVSGTGDNATMSVKMPGSGTVPLKTADGGSSITGSFTRLGQKIDLWLLRIPTQLTPSTLPASELDGIVGSSDGYTSFVTIKLPNGQEMCATSDFILSAADHSFKMTCDSPAMQKIFGTMQGSYQVNGSNLVLTDATGKTSSGEICDNGNYIKIPMGSAQGMTLNLVLIR